MNGCQVMPAWTERRVTVRIGRMGEEIATSRFSTEDYAEYRTRLARETDLLAEWIAHARFPACAIVGGFELEACLTDAHGRPASVNETLLPRIDAPSVVSELAQFDIEINAEPCVLGANALARLHANLRATWTRCIERARPIGVEPLLAGILPSLTEDQLTLAHMTRQTRYRALNEQVFRLRQGRPITLEIEGRERLRSVHTDVMLEAAATSFQIHMQVHPRDAATMYNTAIALSAPMVAVAANSPYLFGRELWAETRIPLFEQAVETDIGQSASRVTLGSGYVDGSLIECFHENLARYPVMLPVLKDEPMEMLAHLRLHNGTIWRWNRPLIGFDAAGNPQWRIEHRVMPAGPSLIDAIANAALFFGLARYYCAHPEPLHRRLDFGHARDNFYTAARHGLDAVVRWTGGAAGPVRELLREPLLHDARAGLALLGIDAADIDLYLGVIAERVRTGQNGAVWQRRYVQRHGGDMRALTRAYRERQRSGAPVHEWTT